MPPRAFDHFEVSSLRQTTNDSVRFIERLGSGVFGEVWKADYKGELVAAKVTSCPTGFRAEEVALLRRAQGKHAVRLLGVEEGTSKGTAIVMELCEGNLHDRVAKASTSEDEFIAYLVQILEGLADMHGAGIVFGDLKPDNLLLDGNKRVVFADFGDARDAQCGMQGRSVHEMGWGSPMYHAKPDVMKQQLTCASDMWMFAQTAIHMWSREEARSNPSPMPSDIPLRELLQQCFATDPSQRPSARDALEECQEAMVSGTTRASRARLPQLDCHPRSPVQTRSRRASLPSPSPQECPERPPSPYRRRRSLASAQDYMPDGTMRREMRLEDLLDGGGVLPGGPAWHSGWMMRLPGPPPPTTPMPMFAW